MSARDEGFLSRWAKRKAEVRETEEREADVLAEREALAAEQQALLADPEQREVPPDDETRQRWIEELEQIDIDALTYDSDFKIFMKSWVPGALRQRALRKLWTSNPTLAVLDGLNDYDLDYTDKAMRAGQVVSSWNPQSGYRKLEELADKVSGLAADEDGATEEDVPDLEQPQDAAAIAAHDDSSAREAGGDVGETPAADDIDGKASA